MSTETLRESIVNKLWADTELHHEDAGPIADAVLDLVAARLAEVEAERDAAVARERDVWNRVNTYNDDPVTRLKALALLDGEYEAMEAQLEVWRPVVEAAVAYFAAEHATDIADAERVLARAVDALPPKGGSDA